jgi:hypothetical protein
MAGREVIESQAVARTEQGTRTLTRVWKVWGVSTTDVINNPASVTLDDGSTLPAIGSSYDGLALKSYSAEPSGNDVITARATYSNDGRFGRPPSPTPVPPAGTIRESASPVSTTVKIPFAVTVPTKISTGPGSAPVEVTTWSFQTEDVPVTFYRWRREVQCPAADVALAFEYAQGQARKLHTWGDGYVYAFEAPEMRQVSDDLFSLTYSWLYDPGNPDAEDDDDPDTAYPFGLTNPLFSGSYVRPPYCVVKVKRDLLVGPPAPGTPDMAVSFYAKLQYDGSDLNGWMSLYGMS